MRLYWARDPHHDCLSTMIGGFIATITEGGHSTIGVTVYVGTFAGNCCAIQATREACEAVILKAAKLELLRAGADLGKVI